MDCKNCGDTIVKNFCPTCGQSDRVERINLSSVWEDFSNNFLGFNSGFLFTVKRLFIAPGHTVRLYIQGHRRQFMKPVQFYLLILTLYFLINSWLGIDFIKIQEEFQPNMDTPRDQEAKLIIDKIYGWYYANIKVVSTFSIPFLALVIRILYRKRPYNFYEYFVFALYVYSITYILSEVFSVVYFYTNSFTTYSMISMGVSLIFITFALTQFFQNYSFRSYIKAAFVYLLSITLFTISIGVVIAVVMAIYLKT